MDLAMQGPFFIVLLNICMYDNVSGSVSEQMFKIVKGYGHNVILFTLEGDRTSDPNEARRIYVKDLQIMINYIDNELSNEIIINVGSDTRLDNISEMLKSIKNVAVQNVIEYTIKTFGKSISPKDFKYQAMNSKKKDSITEGFSGWYGSNRKSINELNNARIVVNHHRTVNEDKMGARTRGIKSIFIENSDGERFRFPYSSIVGAKAMSRHINEGGTPYDGFGSYVTSLLEEMQQLREFRRHSRKNKFCFALESDTKKMNEGIRDRLSNLKENLKTISQVGGYKKFSENYESYMERDNTVQLNELKDAKQVKVFDENIRESLPYVAKILETLNRKEMIEKKIVEMSQYIIENKDTAFMLSEEGMGKDHPDYPGLQEYDSVNEEVTAWSNYLLPIIEDQNLSGMIKHVSKSLNEASEDHGNLAVQVMRIIGESSCHTENEEEKKPIDEEEINSIVETMRKYKVTDLFDLK